MIRDLLRNAGINPRRWKSLPRDWQRFRKERAEFRSKLEEDVFPWGRELPMLGEWRDDSAQLGGYFFQDLLVARWVHELAPRRHVDIGSRIDGFVGHLAVFRNVDVIDIRPLDRSLNNIRFHQLDLTREIPEEWTECTDSLSCLHSIEHFGLGRYGDPLDVDGHLKGVEQLKKMVAPGGILFLSTQIGTQRIEFNAHRVFAPATMLAWFEDGWEIEKSGVVGDDLRTTEGEGSGTLANAGCQTGIGIIAARKL